MASHHHPGETRGWTPKELYAADPYFNADIEHTPLGVALSDCTTFGELVGQLETLCPASPVTKSDWLAIDAYMADIEQVLS